MSHDQKKSKTFHVTLWIAQVLLALSLLSGGIMKLFMPFAQLAEIWPWVAENHNLVLITGVLDSLAAIGLIVPSLLRIQPTLAIYAAVGVSLLMIAAIIFHISRDEASQIGANIFFAAFALFIAWGRATKAVIDPK